MTDYESILIELKSLTENVPYLISNLANISSALYHSLDNINWVGFYILEDKKLILGPFHGKPACIEIPLNKGVCGTSVSTDQTLNVPDVHAFPSHIACDPSSASEIVIPLHVTRTSVNNTNVSNINTTGNIVVNSNIKPSTKNRIWGVLDIDSPIKNRFSEKDKVQLEKIAEYIQTLL